MNDTQPNSSRSLAGGFTEPAFERECYEADEAAAEKELDDRALAANTGLQDLENAVKQYLSLLNGDYYVECLWQGPPPVWRVSPNPLGDPPDPDMVYMQIALPVAVAEEVIRNRKVLELTDAEWAEKRAALQARVDSGDLPPRELAHARSGGRISVDGGNEIDWNNF